MAARASVARSVWLRRPPFTHKRALGAVAALLVLSACTTTHVAPPSSTPSNTPTITNKGTALAACPSPRDFKSLPVFARGLRAPDDLLALSDGTLWVSDPVHGTLRHLSASGETL